MAVAQLVGDRAWPPTTPMAAALDRWRPAPFVALRTLKSEVIVGLPPGVAERMQEAHADWLTTGSFAVVQFVA